MECYRLGMGGRWFDSGRGGGRMVTWMCFLASEGNFFEAVLRLTELVCGGLVGLVVCIGGFGGIVWFLGEGPGGCGYIALGGLTGRWDWCLGILFGDRVECRQMVLCWLGCNG